MVYSHLIPINLRLARVRGGLTQRQLAHRAGLTQQQVSTLERGLWPSDPKQVPALAKALGVTVHSLSQEVR